MPLIIDIVMMEIIIVVELIYATGLKVKFN